MFVSSVNTARSTPAVIAYWNEFDRLDREEEPDSTRFAARRESSSYCRLAACDTTTQTGWSWRRKRDRFEDEAGVPRVTVVGYKGIYDRGQHRLHRPDR